MNPGEGLLFGAIFICVGALVMAILGGIAFYQFRRTAAAQNWQPVTGQVLSSQVVWRGSGKGRSQYPEVIYAYSALGENYQSTRIFVGGELGGTGAGKVAARYPAGSTVQVYYDPQHPEKSVLERRSPTAIFLVILGAFMGLIFCGVGVGLLVFMR